MSDNVGYIGRETTAEALGRTWKFSRLERQTWVDFTEWARTVLPNPLKEMARVIDDLAAMDAKVVRAQMQDDFLDQQRHAEEVAKCSTDEQRRRVRPHIPMAGKYNPIADLMAQKALDKASSYLSFNSPEMSSLLNSIIGSGRLIYLLLRGHQADITESLAFDVAQALAKQVSGFHADTGRPATELDRVIAITGGQAPPTPKNGLAPVA